MRKEQLENRLMESDLMLEVYEEVGPIDYFMREQEKNRELRRQLDIINGEEATTAFFRKR